MEGGGGVEIQAAASSPSFLSVFRPSLQCVCVCVCMYVCVLGDKGGRLD